MKPLAILPVLLFAMMFNGNAQNKKEQDQNAIKAMCGCYEVEFKYAETFSPDSTYKKKDNYKAHALEWVELITDTDDKLSLQHLLVINDTMVIKHWRQDWEFQNQNLFKYESKNTWRDDKLSQTDVAGQWTQKVYQVDDSPRYSGSASWVHVDGKTYWENKTDAPLPRREYTKRHDYNIMARGNTVLLTEDGWVHEQDNDKIIRDTHKKDQLVAQEKGYNTYKKVADSQCKIASDWWKNNNTVWEKVRQEWDAIFAENTHIKLQDKVAGKRLYQQLFALDNTATNQEIKAIITSFLN